MMLTWLAEAHTVLGQPIEARACLAESARIIEANEERWAEAELLHRVPGDLLNAAGDLPAAERHYRQAIAVAEGQSAKLFRVAGVGQLRPALARPGQAGGSPRAAQSDLRCWMSWRSG